MLVQQNKNAPRRKEAEPKALGGVLLVAGFQLWRQPLRLVGAEPGWQEPGAVKGGEHAGGGVYRGSAAARRPSTGSVRQGKVHFS